MKKQTQREYKIEQAKVALHGKFPTQLKYFWYKGIRIDKHMFGV